MANVIDPGKQLGGWYNNPAAGGANQRYWGSQYGWTTGADPTQGGQSSNSAPQNNSSSNNSASSSASSSVSAPVNATVDPMDAINKAIAVQKQANEPAVASYQAQIPEIGAQYANAATNLKGQQSSLDTQYKNLLDSIDTRRTQDVNSQTQITNNELGKRGILGSSTLAGQEIQNATSPVNQNYTNLANQAMAGQSDATQKISASLANLAPQQASDVRAINNAIAALQSGAAQSGSQVGAGLYSSQLTGQLAQQQQAATAAQNAIANAIAESGLKISQQNANTSSGNSAADIALKNAQIQNLISNPQNDLLNIRNALNSGGLSTNGGLSTSGNVGTGSGW